MLGAEAPPLLVSDLELLSEPGDIVGRAACADDRVVIPADVGKIRNLVHLPTIATPSLVQPRHRQQMMRLAGRARACRGWVEQIPQKLIGEEGTGSEDDLGSTEGERARGSGSLRLERSTEPVRPIVAHELLGHDVLESADNPALVIRLLPSSPSQITLEHGF